MSKSHIHQLQNARHNALLQQRTESLGQTAPFSLEIAGHIAGVRIINDSGATTPVRVAESLASFSKPVIWIAEANQYTSDFTPLAGLLRDKVKVVVINGPRVEEVHKQLWPGVQLFLSAMSWEEAFDLALISAEPNDTVLFSPGCRADEPFANFKERGAYINRLVEIKAKTKITIP